MVDTAHDESSSAGPGRGLAHTEASDRSRRRPLRPPRPFRSLSACFAGATTKNNYPYIHVVYIKKSCGRLGMLYPRYVVTESFAYSYMIDVDEHPLV